MYVEYYIVVLGMDISTYKCGPVQTFEIVIFFIVRPLLEVAKILNYFPNGGRSCVCTQ